MAHWFQRMNLSNKLVLLVYACMVGICVVMSIFWFSFSESSARVEFKKAGYDLCASGNQLIDKECSYLLGISAYLSVSSNTQSMLRASSGGRTPALETRVAEDLASLKYAVSLVFYDLAGNPIDSMSIDASAGPVAQDIDADTPFAKLLTGDSSYEWEFIEQNSSRLFLRDNSPKLCLWRLITDSQTTQPLGVMAIAVDTRRFIRMGPTRESLYFKLIQLDQKTARVASNHTPYVLDAEIRQTLTALSAQASSGDDVIRYDGALYYVFFERAGSTPLVTYYLAPYTMFVLNFSSFWVFFMLVFFVLTLALFPLLWYAFRRVTMPLRTLTSSVEGFAQGDLHASFQYDGMDEIGKLGRAFNEMVRANRTMFENTVDLKVREKEAELTALQAQINPHFLYNMLNMIYWKALRCGNDELADISYAMGQLFRMTLKRGRSMISLKEEFEICRYYLMLQKKRFGDHIEYTIEAEPELHCAIVPRLLLQPLVENAIVHGAENYTGTVHIRLHARRKGAYIVFQVINDGTIIPPEILSALPENVTAAPTHRTGNRYALRNIAERLKLLYADQYSFTFESSEKTGTIVTIRFPLARPEPEAKEENSNA